MNRRIRTGGALDARELPDGLPIEADIAIVGAGAAGISIARELAGHSAHVVLIESGGFEPDDKTQALAKGEVVGRAYPPLETTRDRFFGGTTNRWAGFCRPLDPIDFEKREGVPHSGWPLDRSALEPYYRRAERLCQLPPGDWTLDSLRASGADRIPRLSEPRLDERFFRLSPPTRFGEVYGNDLANAPNVDTLLYANVIEIQALRGGCAVRSLSCQTLTGRRFSVSARAFVLATGGIENPRLLLCSRSAGQNGLGNDHDLVGRFFMDHLIFASGMVLPSRQNDTLARFVSGALHAPRVVPALGLSANTIRRERLLNWVAHLSEGNAMALRAVFEWGDSKGMRSLRMIRRGFSESGEPSDLGNHVWNVLQDLDDIARYAFWHAFVRKRSLARTDGTMVLLNSAEPAPNPSSRVVLSAERDQVGVPRVRLDWRLAPIDKRSVRQSQRILGSALGALGLGRLQIQLIDDNTTLPTRVTHGYHHIGTTRMASSPKEGVVDENCRVHGIENLYVAGSSVFPTAGSANPTLTIVALALRLADHLKGVLT